MIHSPGDPAAGTSIAIGSYRPAYPNDLRSIDSYEQASGRKWALIHWYAYWGGWKRDFSRADLDLVAARGAVPLITWEPWAGVAADPAWTLRGAILSGANDAYIDAWARGLADYGRPVLIRFAHEMHNQSYPWAVGINGNTAAEYLAAWRHVRAIFARYPTSNVQWVWNPNTLGDASAATYDPIYRSLYPGDDQVDWIGLDIYNTGPNLNWGAPYWRSFDQALAAPYAAITAISAKPLLLGEVGSTESGGSKPAWLTDALTRQLGSAFPRIRALVWFDINKEATWSIDSSSESRSAWLSGIQSPIYAVDSGHPIWGSGSAGTSSPTATPTATPTASPTSTATPTPTPTGGKVRKPPKNR